MFYAITVASILEATLWGLGKERHPAASAFLVAFLYCGQKQPEGFPGGPVVKNLPANVGDMGLIPGPGTEIPYAAGQLSPWATTI